MNAELEKIYKKTVLKYFKTLTRYFLGDTGESHVICSQDI